MTEDREVMPSFDEISAFADEIAHLLHGKGPTMQGAALADIVARFFAGHHPDIRDESLDIWVQSMRQLVKPNEDELIARYGGPPWDRRTNN